MTSQSLVERIKNKPRGPDFIVIGAQRSGTSWLYFVLKRHSRLWLPAIKEIHYFDNLIGDTADDRNRWLRVLRARARMLNPWMFRYLIGERNDDWYANLFHKAQLRGRIAGEITPAYATLDEFMFQRMRRINENVKLIFIMRDPVDRAWSAVTDAFKKRPGWGSLTLAKALHRAQRPRKVPKGMYTDTIARLEAVFPASQLHFCFYDDLQDRPETLVADILSFLRVNPDEAKNILLSTKINSSSGLSTMPVEFQREMAKVYLPMVRVLCQRFEGAPQKWRARYEQLVQ